MSLGKNVFNGISFSKENSSDIIKFLTNCLAINYINRVLIYYTNFQMFLFG